jgi:transposase-like protein
VPPRRFDEDDVRQIADTYRRGATRRDIARVYGVHTNTITRALKEAEAGSTVGARPTLSESDRAAIATEYSGGAAIADLAKKFGVTAQHISRVAIAGGASARRPNLPGRSPRFGAHDLAVTVPRGYLDGASLRRLGRAHGVAHTTVRDALIANGVPLRVAHSTG